MKTSSRFYVGAVAPLAGLLLCFTSSCGGDDPASGGSGHPPTQEGAKTLLMGFLAPDADRAALTQALKPEARDYDAVFTEDVAGKARERYETLWNGSPQLGPKEGQTELKLWSATTEELRSHTGDAKEFPGGYAKAAPHLQPGLTFYRFKFVKPGEDLGMAYDGLVHVNGQWRFFPKPWNVLE